MFSDAIRIRAFNFLWNETVFMLIIGSGNMFGLNMLNYMRFCFVDALKMDVYAFLTYRRWSLYESIKEFINISYISVIKQLKYWIWFNNRNVTLALILLDIMAQISLFKVHINFL